MAKIEKKYIINIDKTGKMELEANGFQDSTCLKELEKIAAGMGGKVSNVEKKQEAFKNPGVEQKLSY